MNALLMRKRIAILVFTAFVALSGEVATLAVMADHADARRSHESAPPPEPGPAMILNVAL